MVFQQQKNNYKCQKILSTDKSQSQTSERAPTLQSPCRSPRTFLFSVSLQDIQSQQFWSWIFCLRRVGNPWAVLLKEFLVLSCWRNPRAAASSMSLDNKYELLGPFGWQDVPKWLGYKPARFCVIAVPGLSCVLGAARKLTLLTLKHTPNRLHCSNLLFMKLLWLLINICKTILVRSGKGKV